MKSEFRALHKLTSTALRELSEGLAASGTSSGMTNHVLQQIAGASLAEELAQCVAKLVAQGWTNAQIADLAAAVGESRDQAANPEKLFDVVLTGPDVAGVPTRDTAAVFHTLISEARNEVLLVGYAVYNGRRLFEHLASRMRENPQLHVEFLLNIPRNYRDTSLSSGIVRRFATEFASKHWPWSPKPDIYYDPRSLEVEGTKRASLHAKCVVVDKRIAMITSANFTEAAHERNIEAGVVVTYEPFVQRIYEYFSTLRTALLLPCPIPDKPRQPSS